MKRLFKKLLEVFEVGEKCVENNVITRSIHGCS